ncbi:MAG TPA: VOC family protein [Burkholderiales bacterium]|nr:VOC family protein [Burkholderiales bacterium]
MTADIPSLQVPRVGELTLDHVAHFVPDIDAASTALERLGYTLTPFSPQSHRLTENGPLVPAGTGNRCVMLERGYLEFLTPTADTPLAAQLRLAIDRYVGVHLVAFGTSAPDRDFERLNAGGFAPLPAVALQRPIETPSGTDTARFTVVRVAPGTMAEGRIQYCQQHTPELLWQPRWVSHRNTVVALSGVVLCVADVHEAADRYARYTGLPVQETGSGWRMATAHGTLHCISVDAAKKLWRVDPPALPWIAATVLSARDLDVLATYVQNAGCPAWPMNGALRAQLPPELGGMAIFQRADAPLAEL